MRIVFVFPDFLEIHVTKDIGQIFVELSRVGNSCSILTYSVDGNANLSSIDGVRIIKLQPCIGSSTMILSPFYIFHLGMLRYILKHRNEIDCLVSIFNNTMFLPLIFKALCKNKVAIIKMDSDGNLYKGKFRILKKIIGTLLFLALHKGVDLFIIETPEARARLLSRHPWLSDKLVFVPNGVNVEAIDRIVGTRRTASSGTNTSKTILFVGDVIPTKGIDVLLEAFGRVAKDYQEWRVKIVGRLLDRRYFEALQRLTAEKGITNRVVFTGYYPFCDTIQQYVEADIFCFPSRHESFGLVIVEAMYLGKPIISTDVGVARYALADGAGLIFKPDDVDSLERLLKKLLVDPDLRERLGARARERCKQIFDYRVVVAKLDSMIKRAAVTNNS